MRPGMPPGRKHFRRSRDAPIRKGLWPVLKELKQNLTASQLDAPGCENESLCSSPLDLQHNDSDSELCAQPIIL